MKNIFKSYENKNKITGIIALLLICTYFARITYGISIILFILCLFLILKGNKKDINTIKKKTKEKHDRISIEDKEEYKCH